MCGEEVRQLRLALANIADEPRASYDPHIHADYLRGLARAALQMIPSGMSVDTAEISQDGPHGTSRE